MASIGQEIALTAKAIQHALDAGLIEAGGSRSMWTILLALTRARWRTQHEIAQAVGIESPTMTHHLDGLEAAGLVARTRDPSDRRVIRVELTSAGEAMFERLQRTAGAFDLWLRTGLSETDLDQLTRVLDRLKQNLSRTK